MAVRRPGTVAVRVFAVVVALLLASGVAPLALGSGGGDPSPAVAAADDSIVVDDDLPTNGTTAEVVVRLEEATVPDRAGENATERRLEAHAESTQAPLLEYAATTDGLRVTETFWLTNAVLLEVDTDAVDYETFERFGAVEAVHENFEVAVPEPPERINATAATRPASSAATGQKTTAGIAQVNAPAVWDAYDTRGEGVRVAVLDTGVDVSHPDIELATDDPSDPTYPGGWAEFDATGQRVAGSTPHDTGVHGTHVSGTVAGGATTGTAIGVAPEAELLHGLVMNNASGSFAQVVAGMEWAVAAEADVISLSLGATGKYAQLIDPVCNARDSGAVVVAATGNDGPDTSGSPGNVYDAISVGAVDKTGTVPQFSGGERINRSDWIGAPTDWTAPPSYVVPDVVAPGVGIVSAVPGGYAAMPGTSMATPHVSGTAALLLSLEPDATPAEIERALVGTARNPDGAPADGETTAAGSDTEATDTRYGHGIADAGAAADALVDARSGTEPATNDSSETSARSDRIDSDGSGPLFHPLLVGGVALVVATVLAVSSRGKDT